MKIYNGEGMVLGRLAAKVAKDALLGETIEVVNCEKIIISGNKVNTFAREKEKMSRGGYPLKSPKYSRLPDRFVRRTIRGMLPWKMSRGKEAFRRVMCHVGIPGEFAGKELIALEQLSAKKLPNLKYITVGEVCDYLKGKWQRK